MKYALTAFASAAALLTLSAPASAGPASGAAIGAGAGAVVAGPPGAVVGGVVGAVVGGPDIKYYHHHRVHVDRRGHRYYVSSGRRHYI